MVDPQAKGKVRQKLCTTLVEAEERVSRAAETVSFNTTKLAAFLAEKRNGRKQTEASQP